MNQRGTVSGFTLIEILVALAIVAIAMAAVQRSFAQIIDTTLNLRDRNIALWVAQNKLTQYQLEEYWPAVGTHSDATEMASKEWHWVEKVSATQIPDVRRVEIDVMTAGKEYSLAHLVGLVIKPPEQITLK